MTTLPLPSKSPPSSSFPPAVPPLYFICSSPASAPYLPSPLFSVSPPIPSLAIHMLKHFIFKLAFFFSNAILLSYSFISFFSFFNRLLKIQDTLCSHFLSTLLHHSLMVKTSCLYPCCSMKTVPPKLTNGCQFFFTT